MSNRIPYPPYEACPCGSEQKYKFCCFTKNFHYYLNDDDGEMTRAVPVPKELRAVLDQHRIATEKKLGRAVRPDDPLFPDLDEASLQQSMIKDMRKIGIRPVLIYAFEKTGLLVTEQNKQLIPDIDLVAWDDAVEEYYELHPEDDLRTT